MSSSLPLTGQEILGMLGRSCRGQRHRDWQGRHLIHSSLWPPLFLRLHKTRERYLGSHHQSRDPRRTKNWRRIVSTQTYSVVAMDFVMTGGDNILVKEPGTEAITLERMDEVLMSYVEAGKRITPYVDGRIRDMGPRMERDYSEMVAMDLKNYMVNKEEWPPGTPGYLRRQFPEGPEQMHRAYSHLYR
ncbi:hypothetical protein EC957_008009 [Mortierella hygrophila]|uniref:Uncharacterized protein n=1 Tax=Mortierella hygrophila TaxID=979708 RepID=A0A9P6FBN7_9FUNG|nr:hypothetical protein EC957_008009 [Mortierella hygrophila]